MWLARIERPGAIYNASAAARTFSEWERADLEVGKAEFSKIEDEGYVQKEIKSDFEHMPGFQAFLRKNRPNVNKANLSGEYGNQPRENAFYGIRFDFPEKAIVKLKVECGYRIKFPSVDWAGNEFSIEIHCDSGGILTKPGSRAQLGICGFPRKQITEETKNVEYRQGIDVSWVSNKGPTVSTSRDEGDPSIILRFRHGKDVEGSVSGIGGRIYGSWYTYLCSQR